ncbi:MAG: hypothetical protein R2883_07915 [Caldisericia bacterium]
MEPRNRSIKEVNGIKIGVVGAVTPDTTKYVCECTWWNNFQIWLMQSTQKQQLLNQVTEIIVAITSAPGYIEFGQKPADGFNGP